MKQLILQVFVLFIAGISTLNAQISEDDRPMSLGINNAIILDLPECEAKFVEKCWKDYIKSKGGRARKIKKAGEWVTENTDVLGIGGGGIIDLYTSIENVGDDVEVVLWVDMGDQFLTSLSNGEKYNGTEKFLMRFALYVARKSTELELEQEEKSLKKMEQNLKRLKRDNDRYHREIENAKERIKRAEKNIDQNLIDQDNTKKEIELQKEAIESVESKLEELN